MILIGWSVYPLYDMDSLEIELGCMGITIHYRGTMHDLACVEEMEDRVVDLAFSLGGQATIWRSFADRDPTRVVRGLLLEMAPGQDTLSLLVSPEGHLINLFEIEEAEKQPIKEPPYCFVKTQFGSLCGHVAVVYLLDTLKTNYFPKLEVHDEGGFYEHRDPNRLAAELARLGASIHSMADAFSIPPTCIAIGWAGSTGGKIRHSEIREAIQSVQEESD